MKKILSLTLLILLAAGAAAALPADPSSARNLSVTPLMGAQELGELELLDQFGDIPATQQSMSGNNAPVLPDRPDNLGTVTQIGYLESGTIHDLAVQGSYAYAGFSSTLVVIDITDPANMQRVASLQLAGEIQAIEADQDYLYISSYGSGLWIVNIQSPLDPIKTGFYPSLSIGVLAVQGDFAYLAANYGLEIVDISARDNPRLAGFFSVNNFSPLTDLAVEQDYLYLAKLGDNNIWILDISNPIQPVHAGQYTLPYSAWESHIEIDNSTLYLTEDNNGFQVVDITAPAEPKLIGSLYYYGNNQGLATSDDRVYFAFDSCSKGGCQWGFEIIDVSDPASPNVIGTYSSTDPLYTTSIAASGGNVFLTRTGEVQSIDASLPSAPILVDRLNSSLNAPNKIAIAGDYAYIIDYDNEESSRLRIADISNPYQLGVTGQLTLPSTLTDVEISGNIAILTQATYYPGISSVYFIDVSDPQNPVEVGRFDDQSVEFRGVGVQGEYAYVTWEGHISPLLTGVFVLNISDPTNPQKVGFYEQGWDPLYHSLADVVLDGDYAYIPSLYGLFGLLVLDIRNPEVPVKAGEFEGQCSGSDIALAGNLAYLACDGIITLDVSNPANPVEISSFEIQSWNLGVVVQDNYLYVSSQNGLSIVDVSHPMTPTLAAFLPSTGGQDVSIQGREIFFTSSEGFQILHLTGAISGVVKQPNRWPVSDLTILANGIFSATTTSMGAYAFEGMEPGFYTVVPSISEFRFTPGQYQLDVPPSRTANFTMLAHPVSAELTPGAATTLVYTDTQGLPTSFTFPAGLVSTTATAAITPTLASPFFGMDFAGHAFDLYVREIGSPTEILTFTLPVSVTIQYSPMDTAVITDTAGLALYRRDGDAWVVTEDGCPQNPSRAAFEASVFQIAMCRTGRYALYGPTYGIALPYVYFGSDAPGFPVSPP